MKVLLTEVEPYGCLIVTIRFSYVVFDIVHYLIHTFSIAYAVGRDSSVGKATGYGLDGPGVESRWGRDFPQPSLGPTQSPIRWVPGLFSGVKRPGRGVDYPPHLSPRLKKE